MTSDILVLTTMLIKGRHKNYLVSYSAPVLLLCYFMNQCAEVVEYVFKSSLIVSWISWGNKVSCSNLTE